MTFFLRYLILLSLFPLLLTACADSPETYTPATYYGRGSIIVVWDLENFSVTDNQILDDMQDFLTAKISETLKESGGYVIVERQKLLLALEELALGSSLLVDKASQLEVGHLLGAELMVFGGYQQAGEQLRIDLRLVEVASGAVIRTGEYTTTASDVSGLLDAAENVAAELF